VKDKLIVEQDRWVYRICWFIAEYGDYGAKLGESSCDGKGKPPKDREEWEHWAASKACVDANTPRDETGFYWESAKEARAMLATIKLALAQERDLPDWAKTALSHGWKPPKGWKA